MMNAKLKPVDADVVPRLWPWLALIALTALIGILLKLGAAENSPAGEPAPTSMHSPSTPTPTPTGASADADPGPSTVEPALPDGEVDPVPAVSNLPVASGEVRNDQKVHAGDDSVFLKDEDSSQAKSEDDAD